jgi:hypothetical protein
MKRNLLVLLTLSLLVGFAACKKDSSNNSNTNDQLATHSDDQEMVGAGVDGAANDADVALESSAAFTGRYTSPQGGSICDANVTVNTAGDPKTITITYDGTACPGAQYTRTGAIVISMPANTQWKNAGAAVTVTFQNLKITRVRDNKSITINGAKTYTNVSGGLLINLNNQGSITHSITSNGLTVTFDNGTQRSWQVSKQRVFTGSVLGGTVVITTSGAHTDGNTTGIAEWGTNRFGGTFTTQIVEPLVVRQDCSFRLTSGQVKHTTGGVTATATFGLNAAGEATTCPGTGAYYFKVVWTGPNGNSITVIRPY